MAKRMQYVNPFSMGLLGGITDWAKSMEKYNLLNAQNEARQKAYQVKYGAMANVAQLRAQNNMMIAKLKAELPQKQYTQTITGDDGKPVIVKGHMVPDPQNPDAFVPHEDVRMTPEQYAMSLGKGIGGSTMMSVAPGGTVLSKQLGTDGKPQVLFTAPNKPDAQAAILARQQQMEAQRHADALERDKAKQDRADQANKINRVETLTGKDLDKWDKETDDAKKLQMLKDAGVTPGRPDWFGYGSGEKPLTSDQIESMRGAYEDAMKAKHAKSLGVSDKQLEEGPPAPAVEGETGSTLPADKPPPTIIHGADGKAYSLPDGIDPATGQPKVDPATGKVHAIPLAMDTVDTGDNVAQAGGEEAGETTPDSESAEGEQDPYEGLLNQFAQSSDAGLAQVQNQMANDQDQELEPTAPGEDNSLLAG